MQQVKVYHAYDYTIQILIIIKQKVPFSVLLKTVTEQRIQILNHLMYFIYYS